MKKSLFLIFLFCHTLVMAQQYNFISYSLEQGLPQSEVYAIAQNSKGTIWVATHDGSISRFDGKRFYPLALPKNLQNLTINKLVFDKEDNLWIATDAGLFQYDGLNFLEINKEIFGKKQIDQFDLDSEGKAWVMVWEEKAREKKLFIGKEGKYENLSEKYAKEKTLFMGFSSNRTGEIVLWDNQAKAYQYKAGKLDLVLDETTNLILSSKKNVKFHLFDQKKQFWFSHETEKGREIWAFDSKNTQTIAMPSNAALNTQKYIDIEDNKGNLWLRGNLGLVRINPKIGEATLFAPENGLPTADVLYIFEDQDGTIWIGTQGKGLIRFAGERFVHFGKKDGMANDLVWRITEDSKGRMWFAANPKISFWDGKKITNLFHTPETAVQFAGTFAETPEGSVWIPTGGKGLVEYANDKIQPFSNKKWEKMPDMVYHIGQLPSTKIMVHSPFRIQIYSPDRKLLYNIDTTNTPRHYLSAGYATEDSEGNIWYYSMDRGTFKFDGKKVEQVDSTTAIMGAEDHLGRMWQACFTNGLWISDKNGKNKKQITTKEGMSSNLVYSVLKDRKNNIWAGTQNGLDKISLDSTGNILKIKNYGKAEGFTGIETNGWAIYEDSKANIWVGHVQGATRYNPKEDAPNPKAPLLQMSALKLFLKETNWADSAYLPYHKGIEKWSAVPQNLVLPYEQNHLTFDFYGINYRSPEKIRYQWKLLPIDKDWSVASDRTEAIYANLAPQNYTFVLRACNEDGVWSETPLSYEFTITPPFWQTWWAKTLGLSLIFGVAFTGVRVRIKQIEGQKARLEKLVETRTAQVVQQKNEILAKNTVLEQQKEEIVSQNDQINNQNKEITLKNKDLAVAFDLIDKKNKDITASINYAKRIQEAILPFESRIEKAFSEYFIFFQPRDIVSGDFYWFMERKGKKFIAAIDCTGHGIPGAFMSMIADALLNQIVSDREVYEVNLILGELHRGVRHALKQKHTENRDGMDMAICMLDAENKRLEYAGAKNPLYYIQNGEMQIVKADRFPIGGVQFEWETERLFTKNTIDISQKTAFYLFTDGFQDQFNGETKQKFMSKNFRELLLQIHTLPMPEQRQKLNESMKTWIGSGKQLDDILVVGIRV